MKNIFLVFSEKSSVLLDQKSGCGSPVRFNGILTIGSYNIDENRSLPRSLLVYFARAI